MKKRPGFKIDLYALEQRRQKAAEDKANLFDFYNDNWDELVNEISVLRDQLTQRKSK